MLIAGVFCSPLEFSDFYPHLTGREMERKQKKSPSNVEVKRTYSPKSSPGLINMVSTSFTSISESTYDFA